MSEPSLEQRVKELEQTVASLTKRLMPGQKPPTTPDWRSSLNVFEPGDPILEEIIEEGRKIREADRKDAQSE